MVSVSECVCGTDSRLTLGLGRDVVWVARVMVIMVMVMVMVVRVTVVVKVVVTGSDDARSQG